MRSPGSEGWLLRHHPSTFQVGWSSPHDLAGCNFEGFYMGRLKCAPPLLSAPPPLLASAPAEPADRERERNAFNPLRALYNSARWKRLRMATFVRDNFTCQMCGRLEGDTSKLVADHKRPHRGNLTLFWEGELETLCSSPCHSKHKQRLEQAAAYR